jgi:hypothetical protein
MADPEALERGELSPENVKITSAAVNALGRNALEGRLLNDVLRPCDIDRALDAIEESLKGNQPQYSFIRVNKECSQELRGSQSPCCLRISPSASIRGELEFEAWHLDGAKGFIVTIALYFVVLIASGKILPFLRDRIADALSFAFAYLVSQMLGAEPGQAATFALLFMVVVREGINSGRGGGGSETGALKHLMHGAAEAH